MLTKSPPNKSSHYMKSCVAQFVNSFIDRPGNIGIRTGYVLREMSKRNICSISYCRGAEKCIEGARYVSMGYLGHIPRLMNAFRIYIHKSWDHRPVDIHFFQWFSMRNIARLDGDEIKVAHVWDYCPELIKELKNKGVKVILDVPVVPLSYGRRLATEKGIPYFQGSDQMMELEKESYFLADLILAPSEFVYDELILSGVSEDKVRVIEFGAKVTEASPIRVDKESDSGINYCFLGNVNRRKGIIELLNVWGTNDFGRDRLHLCGRIFPEVKSDIEKSGQGGGIVTPGFVDSSSYLQKCHVFVFPSWLEGSSKAVYEAMAHGMPVITTRSAGSIVRDGVDGFVIEAGDEDALWDKMMWFKDHPEEIEKMGNAARHRVSGYTWDRYAEKVVDLYSG